MLSIWETKQTAKQRRCHDHHLRFACTRGLVLSAWYLGWLWEGITSKQGNTHHTSPCDKTKSVLFRRSFMDRSHEARTESPVRGERIIWYACLCFVHRTAIVNSRMASEAANNGSTMIKPRVRFDRPSKKVSTTLNIRSDEDTVHINPSSQRHTILGMSEEMGYTLGDCGGRFFRLRSSHRRVVWRKMVKMEAIGSRKNEASPKFVDNA